MITTNQVLIVATNVGEFQKVGHRTGLWLGELTHFWDVLEASGLALRIASPSGGDVPLDPESLAPAALSTGNTARRYADRAFMDGLKDTVRVADVDPAAYDAIYLAGGHGACFDFWSPELSTLIAGLWESGRVVSAVCHGAAGLLGVKLSGGEHLLDGKKVTGFSWNEEVKVGRDGAVPFSLEDQLRARGAVYEKAWLALSKHVVVDGRLITGQNPASAEGVGRAVVAAVSMAAAAATV